MFRHILSTLTLSVEWTFSNGSCHRTHLFRSASNKKFNSCCNNSRTWQLTRNSSVLPTLLLVQTSELGSLLKSKQTPTTCLEIKAVTVGHLCHQCVSRLLNKNTTKGSNETHHPQAAKPGGIGEGAAAPCPWTSMEFLWARYCLFTKTTYGKTKEWNDSETVV